MENYKKSSIFDSLEERYHDQEVSKTEWLIDIASLFLAACIVVALMCLSAKALNLF